MVQKALLLHLQIKTVSAALSRREQNAHLPKFNRFLVLVVVGGGGGVLVVSDCAA